MVLVLGSVVYFFLHKYFALVAESRSTKTHLAREGLPNMRGHSRSSDVAQGRRTGGNLKAGPVTWPKASARAKIITKKILRAVSSNLDASDLIYRRKFYHWAIRALNLNVVVSAIYFIIIWKFNLCISLCITLRKWWCIIFSKMVLTKRWYSHHHVSFLLYFICPYIIQFCNRSLCQGRSQRPGKGGSSPPNGCGVREAPLEPHLWLPSAVFRQKVVDQIQCMLIPYYSC
jgi:hypothetical protein